MWTSYFVSEGGGGEAVEGGGERREDGGGGGGGGGSELLVEGVNCLMLQKGTGPSPSIQFFFLFFN